MPNRNARPAAGKHTGRALNGGQEGASTPARRYLDYPNGCLLVARKHGKRCVLAKVVRWKGDWIVAMPYENRAEVREYVSLPMAAVQVAQDFGCRSWVFAVQEYGARPYSPVGRRSSAGPHAGQL